MLKNAKRETSTLAFRCKLCNKIVEVCKEQINLRESGYKGWYQSHTTCSHCKKDTVIGDEFITKEIRKHLDARWLEK